MVHDFRVYGHLVIPDATQRTACAALLYDYECEGQDQILNFIHEGRFVDVDSTLDRLLEILGPEARGVIDIINHQDWEMHRCTIAGKKLTRERIALNNALDTAYASERP